MKWRNKKGSNKKLVTAYREMLEKIKESEEKRGQRNETVGPAGGVLQHEDATEEISGGTTDTGGDTTDK